MEKEATHALFARTNGRIVCIGPIDSTPAFPVIIYALITTVFLSPAPVLAGCPRLGYFCCCLVPFYRLLFMQVITAAVKSKTVHERTLESLC